LCFRHEGARRHEGAGPLVGSPVLRRSRRGEAAPPGAWTRSLRSLWLRGRRTVKAWVLVSSLVGMAAGVSGCRHFGVRAHQRELLADRIMSMEGNVQERAADEHILSNREGAVGGTGTAGGGCGCN